MSDPVIHAEALRYVQSHYIDCGWATVRVPQGALVDLITSRGDKMHFVKIIRTAPSKTYLEGIAKNEYIQNAFSNSAIPVYVLESEAGGNMAFKFINPNTESRVVVRGVVSSAKKSDPAPPSAKSSDPTPAKRTDSNPAKRTESVAKRADSGPAKKSEPITIKKASSSRKSGLPPQK